MATYSFMDVTASLSGPTGEIDLGYGSASSEEGITVAMGGPKNTMTIGADGEVMHRLHADKSGTVTVNLLKTSPTNKKLSLAQLTPDEWLTFLECVCRNYHLKFLDLEYQSQRAVS